MTKLMEQHMKNSSIGMNIFKLFLILTFLTCNVYPQQLGVMYNKSTKVVSPSELNFYGNFYGNGVNITNFNFVTPTNSGFLSSTQFSSLAYLPVSKYGNSYDLLPVKGYNSWFEFSANPTETGILEKMTNLIVGGFKAQGYDYMLIDAGLFNGRGADGLPTRNTNNFPNGFPWLCSALHSNGFKVGIYTGSSIGMGPTNPQNFMMFGSYLHEETDALYFVSNHVDYIKFELGDAYYNNQLSSTFPYTYEWDFHNTNYPGYGQSLQSLAKFCRFMRLANYPVHINVASSGYIPVFNQLANSWRMTGFVGTNGPGTNLAVGDITGTNWFAIMNSWQDKALESSYVYGPWSYVDMDAIDFGQMSSTQAVGVFAIHAIFSSSMQIGVYNGAHDFKMSQMTNSELVAIHEDSGFQPPKFAGLASGCYVYVKPLGGAGGREKAVCIQNRTMADITPTFYLTNAGFAAHENVKVRDVLYATNTFVSGSISTFLVPSKSAILLRVSPLGWPNRNLSSVNSGGVYVGSPTFKDPNVQPISLGMADPRVTGSMYNYLGTLTLSADTIGWNNNMNSWTTMRATTNGFDGTGMNAMTNRSLVVLGNPFNVNFTPIALGADSQTYSGVKAPAIYSYGHALTIAVAANGFNLNNNANTWTIASFGQSNASWFYTNFMNAAWITNLFANNFTVSNVVYRIKTNDGILSTNVFLDCRVSSHVIFASNLLYINVTNLPPESGELKLSVALITNGSPCVVTWPSWWDVYGETNKYTSTNIGEVPITVRPWVTNINAIQRK